MHSFVLTQAHRRTKTTELLSGRLNVQPIKIPIFFKASQGCAFTMRHLRAVDAGFVTQ